MTHEPGLTEETRLSGNAGEWAGEFGARPDPDATGRQQMIPSERPEGSSLLRRD